MTDSEAYQAGKERGSAAGSWVIDGTTTEDSAAYILEGIENGDPEILDMAPAPLSGEWAGESIPELSDRYSIDLGDWDEQQRFCEGFDVGYWDAVERDVRSVLGQ